METPKRRAKSMRPKMDWMLTRCEEADEEGYVSDGAEADLEDEGYDEGVDPEEGGVLDTEGVLNRMVSGETMVGGYREGVEWRFVRFLTNQSYMTVAVRKD